MVYPGLFADILVSGLQDLPKSVIIDFVPHDFMDDSTKFVYKTDTENREITCFTNLNKRINC